MLGWRRRATIFASSRNISRNSRFLANSSRIILMAAVAWSAGAPAPAGGASRTRATYTVAIPPSATRARSSYRPRRKGSGSEGAKGMRGTTVVPCAAPMTTRPLATVLLALAPLVATTSCKDQGKESAAHAAQDVAQLADLVDKDIGEVERGLPEGAKRLAPLVAGGADP